MRFLGLFFLISFATFGQDIIVKTDESRFDAWIVEIGPSLIKYKKARSNDDREYSIKKRNVLEIYYDNGEVLKLNVGLVGGENYETEFGRHYISYSALAILYSNFAVSYEYFFSSGDFSIKIPLAVGFGELVGDFGNTIDEIGRNKRYSVGIDVNFFPSGQGRIRYFLGFGFEYGQFNHYRYYQTNTTGQPSLPYQYDYRTAEVGEYFAVPFRNGFLVQLTKNFNIQLATSIGVGKNFADYGNTFKGNMEAKGNNLLYWNTSINLGIRF
ncbi:MAG TPA: hypothetical protein VF691_16445 [Cytophagaceae bacterium]|jgi:hypothetical protein